MLKEINLVINKHKQYDKYILELGDNPSQNLSDDFFAKKSNGSFLAPIEVSQQFLKQLYTDAAIQIENLKNNDQRTNDEYILITIVEIYTKAQENLKRDNIILEFSQALRSLLEITEHRIQNKQAKQASNKGQLTNSRLCTTKCFSTCERTNKYKSSKRSDN